MERRILVRPCARRFSSDVTSRCAVTHEALTSRRRAATSVSSTYDPTTRVSFRIRQRKTKGPRFKSELDSSHSFFNRLSSEGSLWLFFQKHSPSYPSPLYQVSPTLKSKELDAGLHPRGIELGLGLRPQRNALRHPRPPESLERVPFPNRERFFFSFFFFIFFEPGAFSVEVEIWCDVSASGVLPACAAVSLHACSTCHRKYSRLARVCVCSSSE